MNEALSQRRMLQFAVGTGALALAWQIASLFFPDYLFPSIPRSFAASSTSPRPGRRRSTC